MSTVATSRIGTALPTGDADRGRLADSRSLVYVDTLRGIAILMVIVVHHGMVFGALPLVRLLASYGQMGVQLFFVASAFTLCVSADARKREPHPIRSFYIRRFFRIAPLYYLGIAAYFTLWLLTGERDGIHGHDHRYTIFGVVVNVLFVHGFFPREFNFVVPGGWSIATEMAFYAIFPLLFRAVRMLPPASGPVRIAVLIGLVWAVGAVVTVAISRAADLPLANNQFLYCSIVNQRPVFLIGMAGYRRIVDQGGFAPRPLDDAACFILLTAVTMVLIGQWRGSAIVALPAVAAVSFLFLLNIVRAKVRLSGPVERIGQVSFSMYIAHFVFAWPMTKAIVAVSGALPYAKQILYLPTLALTIGLTFIVALVSKRLIENPFIDVGKRVIRRLNA